jgi:hypothetical protein
MWERHEVLRSTFRNVDGKPLLAFDGRVPEIELTDLSQSGHADVTALVQEEIAKPFDLANGPLLRLAVAKVASDEHVLVLTMHHIVSDGWSVGIVMRELVAGYNAFATNDKPALPSLPLQYADFAGWQRDVMNGAGLKSQMNYWRNQLEEAPKLINLPLDHARPPVRTLAGARTPLIIASEDVAALKRLARSEHVTTFMALLASFQFLLACLTGDDDVVVGSPTAGRSHSETEHLIGYFVNTLVLRARLSGGSTFRATLNEARKTTLEALANQDVPFEKLVDELGVARTLEFNPLFQVWFVLQNAVVERQDWRGLESTPIDLDTSTTRHDLQLTLWESGEGIEGALTYATDLFNADTIEGFAEQFRAVVSIVASEPDISLNAVRARLSAIRSEREQERSSRVAETTRDRLRASRRRAVTATQTAEAKSLETI